MTDWTSLDYAVIDVEGNGQQPPDLVELAVVPIRSGVIGESASLAGQAGRTYQAFRHPDPRPDKRGRRRGAAVHGHRRSGSRCPGHACPGGSHAHVDIDVLTRKLAGWQPPEVLDTLRIARQSPARPSQLPTRHTHQRLPPGRRPAQPAVAPPRRVRRPGGGPAVRQAGDPRDHARRTTRQPAWKGGRRCSVPFLTIPAACSSPWTVIIQADPEIIARRLRERGAHNRFQLPPGSRARRSPLLPAGHRPQTCSRRCRSPRTGGDESTGQQRRVMIFIRSQEDGMIHSVRLPRTTSRSS